MINAFCFYYGENGWSRGGRYFFDAWQKREQVRIIAWDGPTRESDPSRANVPSNLDPGVGLGPIECMVKVVGSKRIAFVVWETTILPPAKINVLRSMDEVWTPSRWGRQLLVNNGIEASKVRVVPKGVDVQKFKPELRQDVAANRFRFLFVGKWEVRKGVEDLIRAFCAEFRAVEPVELVLHGANPYLPNFSLTA